MAAIIERVPWLDERVSIKRFTKELEDVGGTESIYAALQRESGTKMGMAISSRNLRRAWARPKTVICSMLSTPRWENALSR